MTVTCSRCGRGREACQWCERETLQDWEAMCDCGLHDFDRHLVDCLDRKDFRYVVAYDHGAAELAR